MERGAQLDSLCNDREKTALHIAIQYQSNECVRILIAGGCDVNLKVVNYIIHIVIEIPSFLLN